jgi:putative heme-binding domain-containing protein
MAALAAGLQRAGTSLLKSDTEGRLPNVFERAARQAVRQECPVAERVAALELLGFAPRRDRESALRACLVSGQPDEVQQAALKAWGAGGERMETVLEMWGQYSPATRDTVLRMMLGRQERVRPLLEAVNSGKVPATALSAAQVQALLKSKDPAIALFASKVLSSVLPPSRDEVMGRFQPAVDLAGEPVRGQAVYAARCAACHRAGSEGVAVGPDLVTVKTRGRAGLLSAILEPNKEVAAQYILYTVNTKKGETLTGFIHEDTAGSVTLRMAGGLDQKVERAQIQSMLSSGQSLMPEGLEAGLSVQEMADLLTFIQEVK